MAKGWTPKHRPTRKAEAQWAFFSHVADDPLPTDPALLRLIVDALLSLIEKSNPTLGHSLRLHIRAMTVRERWPSEHEANWYQANLGHLEELFKPELDAIRIGQLIRGNHFPAVIRLQRDCLHAYLVRQWPDGLKKSEPLWDWFLRNQKRLHEELSFYHCACTYAPSLDLEKNELLDCKGPSGLIVKILCTLHRASRSVKTFESYLKPAHRTPALPPYFD